MPNILPVLLGADMNCYSMARTFHEAYGVISCAFGRWAMGETKYSRIVRFTAIENFDTDAVMLSTLETFAASHQGESKIALGCTDDYVALLIRNKTALQTLGYIVPYIDMPLWEKLVSKENFYKYCNEFNLAYPHTAVIKSASDICKLSSLPFGYPIIIKPSSSIEYWKHEFAGMKKVYVATDEDHAIKITKRIFESGYTESVIAQDMIPGADDQMRVLTAYADSNHKVKMTCLGHVLLEEHTPRALGNHAAIITEANRPLMQSIAAFLEAIGYTGFANFDIKYDERDGQYKLFEINLRQGRSNYYVTGAGLNLAKYLVEDILLEKDLGEPLYFDKESYWHSVPNSVVWKYTKDAFAVKKAKELISLGKESTTLGYKFDLKANPMRRLYLWEHYRRYKKKYATWHGVTI